MYRGMIVKANSSRDSSVHQKWEFNSSVLCGSIGEQPIEKRLDSFFDGASFLRSCSSGRHGADRDRPHQKASTSLKTRLLLRRR